MRAANMKVIISRESQKQIIIQELLRKGITETKDGKRVEDLDFYEARSELALAKIKDGSDIKTESAENKWF